MKPTTYPPATPTDYAGRGVRNRPTVDLASPVPAPEPEPAPESSPESGVDRGYLSEPVRSRVAGHGPDQAASPWRRLQAAIRERPMPAFAAAIVCGWLLGASTRGRRARHRPDDRR